MAIRSRRSAPGSSSVPALRAYHRKRDLRASGEPRGSSQLGSAALPRFVIQKHDATRLHYDLRLEMDDVLRSWAVPKGLPTKPGDKALAIEVEDHPLDYGAFEGNIPAGNYGAGTVMLWDRGHYVTADDPVTAWKRGRIHFALSGEKLLGEWTLIRLPAETRDKRNWIVVKKSDSTPPRRPQTALERSVLTGRTLEEIAAAGMDRPTAAKPKPVRQPSPTKPAARRSSGPRRRPPAFVEPMKALAVRQVPPGDWNLELKYDGYRAIAIVHRRQVTLQSRNARDLTSDFPEIAEALKSLSVTSAVLDGEIVALDAEGRPSFQLLQQRDNRPRPPLLFYVFDLLHLDGASRLDEPLETRQAGLHKLLHRTAGPVKASPVFDVDPAELLHEVRLRGLEGIIAKRRGSAYEPGRRSGAWVKCRVINEQEFVIGGFTAPHGTRRHFGALLVGYFARGRLRFAGKVGTGFDDRLLQSLQRRLQNHVRDDCPFSDLPRPRRSRYGAGATASALRGVTWVEPMLVCQVRFTEWTDDGSLRHPVFVGLREDKPAKEVRREASAAPQKKKPRRSPGS